jgi:hypothetical protein
MPSRLRTAPADVDALLYVTVWTSLSLFATAELARPRTSRPWPRVASAAGLALMVVHILIAMAWRHHWSHASSIVATAQQTREVYGLDWGGGVYVNYVLVIVWGLSLVPWFRGAGVPRFWVLVTRGLLLVVIANAAIVFAAGWRRGMGALIVAVLVYAWSRRPVEQRRQGFSP